MTMTIFNFFAKLKKNRQEKKLMKITQSDQVVDFCQFGYESPTQRFYSPFPIRYPSDRIISPEGGFLGAKFAGIKQNIFPEKGEYICRNQIGIMWIEDKDSFEKKYGNLPKFDL